MIWNPLNNEVIAIWDVALDDLTFFYIPRGYIIITSCVVFSSFISRLVACASGIVVVYTVVSCP